MKIFFKTFFISFCMFLLLSSSTLGCHKSIQEDISSIVSETRENFFMGKSDNCIVTFTDGRREQDYKMDGIHTKPTPYGVIVLRVEEDLGTAPEYQLFVGEKTYCGTLEINPFDMTYVADIGEKVGNIDKITFVLPDNYMSLELTNLSNNWSVSCSKALDIFVNKQQSSLARFYNNDALDGEVFIKIVQNNNSSDIFYYVLFVAHSTEVVASLIDVSTGQIVQQ